jgi:hypothetical protein
LATSFHSKPLDALFAGYLFQLCGLRGEEKKINILKYNKIEEKR